MIAVSVISTTSCEAGTDEETLKKIALDQESLKPYIDGKEIKKIIVVKNKLVNIVV